MKLILEVEVQRLLKRYDYFKDCNDRALSKTLDNIDFYKEVYNILLKNRSVYKSICKLNVIFECLDY